MSKKNGVYIITKPQLERLRSARMSVESIAAALGCDPGTVRIRLKLYDMPLKLPPRTFTDDEISQVISDHEAWQRAPQRHAPGWKRLVNN